MGSPAFALPTLDALVEAPDFPLVCVVTQPDRPRGRGRRSAPTPVKQRAEAAGLRTMEMSREAYHAAAERLAALRPDFIVVAAFGIILREDLLDLPPKGCVNLHASLLPRYRGMSPVQAAILGGDTETGCTTMRMDAGVDTGDILLQRTVRIDARDTAGTLEGKL